MTKGLNTTKRGRIFLRNLPFKDMNEAKLKELFSKFGEISEVNLPKKDSGELKGFAFVQFMTRRDAIKAIKEMNNKKVDGRKIQASLAVAKEEYGDGKNRKEQNLDEDEDEDDNQEVEIKQNNKQDKNKKSSTKDTNEGDQEKEEKKIDKPLLNDPNRTLFIRNLGFDTNEENLKTFFSTIQGNVIYAKIVRDYQTKVSKGTGFVMFKSKDDVETVLNLYYKYNNRQKSNEDAEDFESSSLNPFELDGRNLKLFRALSKDDAVKMDKETEAKKNEDKRNRPLLYYGLSASNFKYFLEEHQLITDEDQQRRETLIKIKKTNFNKNPNYHVSDTRLTIRNLDKNINEHMLRNVLKEKVEQCVAALDEAGKKKYSRLKKIKQVKLLKDKNETDKEGNNKSKCVAFVEVCDFDLAKNLINMMSNMKLNQKSSKGLILDFALEDIRKIKERTSKIEKIKEKLKKKEEKSEEVEKLTENVQNENVKDYSLNKNVSESTKENIKKIKESKISTEQSTGPAKSKPEKKQGDSITTITDISKLKELYSQTFSRGKRQRIKKKLRALGFTEPLDTKNKNSICNDNPIFSKPPKQDFIVTKIENDKTNLNKKILDTNRQIKADKAVVSAKDNKNKNRRDKKADKNQKEISNTLNQKNANSNSNSNDNQNKKLLNNKRKREHVKSSKNDSFIEDSDNDADDDMNPYYSQILQNLKKAKN